MPLCRTSQPLISRQQCTLSIVGLLLPPDDGKTVGGRWLERGVYAYVGSVDEPYLEAFVTPRLLTNRLQMLTPFLIAAREIAAPPWKITTIGDPLMTILKPTPRILHNPQ